MEATTPLRVIRSYRHRWAVLAAAHMPGTSCYLPVGSLDSCHSSNIRNFAPNFARAQSPRNLRAKANLHYTYHASKQALTSLKNNKLCGYASAQDIVQASANHLRSDPQCNNLKSEPVGAVQASPYIHRW